MTGFWVGVAISVATGAVVNEFCDVSPWLAKRLMRRAALLWAATDSALASGYVVEWASLLEDCPGKITKLLLALRFLVGAAGRTSCARVQRLRCDLPVNRSSLVNDGFIARLSALSMFTSTVGSVGLILFGAVAGIVITAVAASGATATAVVMSTGSRAKVDEEPWAKERAPSQAPTSRSAWKTTP